jgi:hypothetical protein
MKKIATRNSHATVPLKTCLVLGAWRSEGALIIRQPKFGPSDNLTRKFSPMKTESQNLSVLVTFLDRSGPTVSPPRK